MSDDQDDDLGAVGFVRVVKGEDELRGALARLADRLPDDIAERLRADVADGKPPSEIVDGWLERELRRARVRRRMKPPRKYDA